jgi:hypothetical protein
VADGVGIKNTNAASLRLAVSQIRHWLSRRGGQDRYRGAKRRNPLLRRREAPIGFATCLPRSETRLLELSTFKRDYVRINSILEADRVITHPDDADCGAFACSRQRGECEDDVEWVGALELGGVDGCAHVGLGLRSLRRPDRAICLLTMCATFLSGL